MPVALAKRTYTLTRSAATVGETDSVALTGLGQTGNIVKFSIRLDATSDRASAGILYIADDPITSTAAVPSKDLVYQSGTITSLVGSATASASVLYLTIWAEVRS